MIGDFNLEPVSDIILPGTYILQIDLGENLYFKYEDWGNAKFGIFFFDDIGLGIPIFSLGYCLDLTDTVLLYGEKDMGGS